MLKQRNTCRQLLARRMWLHDFRHCPIPIIDCLMKQWRFMWQMYADLPKKLSQSLNKMPLNIWKCLYCWSGSGASSQVSWKRCENLYWGFWGFRPSRTGRQAAWLVMPTPATNVATAMPSVNSECENDIELRKAVQNLITTVRDLSNDLNAQKIILDERSSVHTRHHITLWKKAW